MFNLFKSFYIPVILVMFIFTGYMLYTHQQNMLVELSKENSQLTLQVNTLTETIDVIKEHQNFVNEQLSVLDNKMVNITTYTDSLAVSILNQQNVRKSNVKDNLPNAVIDTNNRVRSRMQSITKATTE